MANPFPNRFDSECQECGNTVMEGEFMYAHDGQFICEDCLPDENACPDGCGNYKKEGFETCWECKNNPPSAMT